MNVERWAQALKEEYPRGLLGEREALVSLLVGKGLSHAEAVEVAVPTVGGQAVEHGLGDVGCLVLGHVSLFRN